MSRPLVTYKAEGPGEDDLEVTEFAGPHGEPRLQFNLGGRYARLTKAQVLHMAGVAMKRAAGVSASEGGHPVMVDASGQEV